MRVSTSQIYNIANIGMRDAQVAVDKTNQQISTGKRVLSPADDPVAATAILMLNQELARTSQFSKNIDSANNNLSLEETALESVVSLITRLKELGVRAGSTAVLTPSDYKAIAAEVDSRLGELLNLQNTRNSSGQYIFAGFQSEIQPFVNKGGGNYSYQGDEGQLYAQASASVTIAVSDSGKKVFMDIPSSHNTFNTRASSANQATPPAIITVGDVYDQLAFDKLYPEDMVVTFNANSAVGPAAPNYTITERSSGKILVDKQLYVSGQDIQINGAKFSIFGSPQAGVAATPAAIPFGTFSTTNFSGVGNSRTMDITVGGVTETLTFDQNITSSTELVTALGGDAFYPNPNPLGASASGADNFRKLQNLGITLNATGFSSPSGLNISIKNGSANIDTVTGLTNTATGVTSPNIPFPPLASYDFSLVPATVDITVNGKTETLVLSTNVTDPASLAAAVNNSTNAAALTKLGVIATPLGFSSVNNSVITLSNGSASVYATMGLTGGNLRSSQGVLAIPGDKFIIESTKNQDVLTTVSRFSEAMKGLNGTQQSKDDLAKIIAKTLVNLENVITNLSSVQGEVGARQNMLDSTKDLNADIKLNSEEVLSQLQNLDYAEASTRLQMQTFILSAAQQSFIKISDLSLFKYM